MADRKIPEKGSDEFNRRVVAAIDALREEEGQAVQIPNDNADFGGPSNVIIWHRHYEDDQGLSFSGETILECLEKAVALKNGSTA